MRSPGLAASAAAWSLEIDDTVTTVRTDPGAAAGTVESAASKAARTGSTGSYLRVVEVRAAVGGGGGGLDRVGARLQRDGEGGGLPGRPGSGAWERVTGRDDGAVDGDVHRPVGRGP